MPNHELGEMGRGDRTEIIIRHEPGTVVEIARGEANNVYVQREPGTVGKAVKTSQASMPSYLNEQRMRTGRG